MKKTVPIFLIVTILCSILTTSCFADGEFHESALTASSRYQSDGEFWSIGGDYVGLESNTNITVIVSTFLTSTYASSGWGPELRVACRTNRDDYEVTAFRATINGKKFLFEKLAYNADPRIHVGYMFGGTVYEEFMKELVNVKTASIQVVYKDASGTERTLSIGHVHTGDLSNLISVSKYYSNANAFSTDIDPAWSDAFYGASIN